MKIRATVELHHNVEIDLDVSAQQTVEGMYRMIDEKVKLLTVRIHNPGHSDYEVKPKWATTNVQILKP